MEPKYKRVLLKLSGEALAGDGHVGIDYDNTVLSICLLYTSDAADE